MRDFEDVETPLFFWHFFFQRLYLGFRKNEKNPKPDTGVGFGV